MDVQLNCYFCVELKFLIQKPFLLQNSESEIIILRDPIFFEDLAKTKRQAKRYVNFVHMLRFIIYMSFINYSVDTKLRQVIPSYNQ